MNGWQYALLLTLGLALIVFGLICAVAHVRSVKREVLKAPHWSVGRDCYRWSEKP